MDFRGGVYQDLSPFSFLGLNNIHTQIMASTPKYHTKALLDREGQVINIVPLSDRSLSSLMTQLTLKSSGVFLVLGTYNIPLYHCTMALHDGVVYTPHLLTYLSWENSSKDLVAVLDAISDMSPNQLGRAFEEAFQRRYTGSKVFIDLTRFAKPPSYYQPISFRF